MEDNSSNAPNRVPLPDKAGTPDSAPATHDSTTGSMHSSAARQEHEMPILDIHAPHAAAHTWRDFFIHLATIVIGLLIAVGLEQLVERAHNHYKVIETRQALQREREANGKDLITVAHNWRWEMAELQNNLMVLQYIQQHPGAPQASLPGELRWVQLPVFLNHAAWDSAQLNGVIRLMPPNEADLDQQLYQYLQVISENNTATWHAVNNARRFSLLDPDPTHLSAQQLAETIELTEAAILKHLEVGFPIAMVNRQFRDFPAFLSFDEVRTTLHSPYEQDPEGMAAAHQRTMDRLKAAGYVPTDDVTALK